MKKFVLMMLFIVAIPALATEGRFMRYPAISGDKIVFSYEGDLWLVPRTGGTAMRITNAPGTETFPKFSPDGKSIAFSGSYDGGQQVYVIPAEGGEPKRLTYLPGYAGVLAWTPDGSNVIFRSNYEMYISRDPKLYSVAVNGNDAPAALPLDRGVNCSFSPDGKQMLYTRRGVEEYYWKRYKGGQYPDIWMYNFDAKSFTKMTDYVGRNAFPMWVGSTMYFNSDRGENGITNLYAMDLNTKKVSQVTTFNNFDVMSPSTDGRSIVFVQNGYLNVLDLASGTVAKLTVTIPSDRWMLRERTINPRDYVHAVSLSNDGSTAIVEARGDLFNVPTGKGATINLSNTPGVREEYPQISPDGKWVAYFSDNTGDYQLYIQPTSGGTPTQLTSSLVHCVYKLFWSPDGKKILFGNKDYSIFVVDVATKKMKTIDSSNQMKNDEFYWEISDYNWSPDSKWITYSFVQENRNSKIFLYNIETGKRIDATGDFFDNLYPSFDQNGKYLYFVSSRGFDIQMDFYEDDHVYPKPQQIMAIELRDGQKPLFQGDDSKMEKAAAAAAGDLRIDGDGLVSRVYPVPVGNGNYFYLKASKNKILWCSVPTFTEAEYEEIFKPKGAAKWELHIYDVDSKKETVLPEKISNYFVSTNGEQLTIIKDKDVYTTTVDQAFAAKSMGEKLNLSGMVYTVDPEQEWNQIFSDAWRWYRDFFYDKNMHGRDWKAIGDKYREYIPFLSTREDLNWVLSQMVGELCVSHTYIGGGDNSILPNPPENRAYTGWLGADLTPDLKSGFYQISKIYGPTELNRNLISPLSRPDIQVKEGDYLLAINGQEIKPPTDYWRMLQTWPGRKITVTVNSKPSREGEKTFEVELTYNNPSLRYARWLNGNVNKVLAATNGRVGYMHINAMGGQGISEFDRFWRAFRYKDGVIIDVRRNSGGWTEYFLIDKLERKVTAYNVLRDMVPFRYPGSAGDGQYVAVSNEDNGSDGEAFIEDFKANNLGPVVGVPSWGGLVGILNTQTTIDNGSVEQSNNAFFGRAGKWLVENHGADPDVVIDNDPASVMAGKDPQLDKAIEVILKNIKEHPFQFPPRPAYPVK